MKSEVKVWQPLNKGVMVERIPDKEKLILLTDVQTLRWGRVLAIGPKVEADIKPGDVVLLPGIAADEPDFVMGQQILVQEGDIGCKVS